MRRLLALIVLAGLVAFAAPAQASAAGKRKASCAAKRSHTVAKNRFVRVYSVSRNGNRKLTGCLRKTGRKLLVVREYDDGFVESGVFRDVRLAGRFVAVVFDATDISCKAACPPDYEPTQTSVVISNIRTRRDRTTRTHAQAGSLRLSTAGVAAWLAPIEGRPRAPRVRRRRRAACSTPARSTPPRSSSPGSSSPGRTTGAPKSAALTPLKEPRRPSRARTRGR